MRPFFLYPLCIFDLFVNQCFAALLSNPTTQNRTATFGKRLDAPWHLLSISSELPTGAGLPRGFDWQPPKVSCEPGKDVVAYVIDSGVDAKHPEFKNSVIRHLAIDKYTGDPTVDSAEDSHGTTMASLIIGENVGLAPHAELVSVKIGDGKYPTDLNEIMEIVDAAMEVIFKDFQSHYSPETHFGVINLSFDLLHRARASSDPWLDKMTHAKKLGMIFVNSASNNAKNRTSPPKTYEIIVGASNEFNEVSSFSNRGSCVDLWAPGSRIRAALKGGLYSESDGTSNSAAFVAGMIAYTKSCLLGPNDKATRDVFVDMFTRERIPVLEPLASVIQNAQPWLAKLPITLATNHAENSHVQAPMESHAFVQKALWHLIAVTSRNQNYITKQRKSEWEFDPGLLEPETDGNGVTVYLLDSGVDFNHPDFSHTSHIEAGYAINIPEVQNGNTDARKDSSNAGHGVKYIPSLDLLNGGVSPYATLFPIKICGSGDDCDKMAKIAPNFMHRIYAGIRMAINHFKTVAKVKKGVISINWPLFYDHENDNKWKDLIKEADAAGLIVVVPAGDNGEDRCFIINAKPVVGKTRPPKSKEFVVGASTEWNQDATFSNRGACVDVWAPGTRITAAAPSFGPHDARYAVQDGTEHSSAIVTGIIAGILSKQTKPTWTSVFVELISKKAMVDVCKGCLLDGQPFLVKHAGKLAYPKKIT